jgi:outer membrane protein TolC
MSRPLACLLLFALASPALRAAPEAPAPVSPWPSPPATVEALVAEAWQSNLALAGESLEVERAAARLAEARSHFLPRLDLSARYSVADGGRTIDLPLGDLLNGAYATLNQYLVFQGQPARFPTIENQSISLLRSREQDTHLRLTQPLYAPEIKRSVAAARAGLAAREAQLAAFRRQLRAEVHDAFFRHEQATAAIGIYASALDLVEESLRVNRSLAKNDKITDDVVLRAEAEVATVRQQLAEATATRDLARRYVNFLLNRPLETPLPSLADDEASHYADALATAEIPAADSTTREELASLRLAKNAARQAADAVQARRRPTLALAIDGGSQGESYRTGKGSGYAMGSLVLDWNLFDGHERRSQIAQARIDERQSARQLTAAEQQLALQVQQARDDFATARIALHAASLRRDAARAAYRLVARREAEGLANQLTVLDARNTLTSAELNYIVTRARLATAAADFDRAAALTPLP